MAKRYNIPTLPLQIDLETKDILRQVNLSNRSLAELKGVARSIPNETIVLINGISALMAKYKNILRPAFGRAYKHDLLNNLFFHPYTKIEYIERDMGVQRKTAAKYLDKIVSLKLLSKVKIGTSNYYINDAFVELFMNQGKIVPDVETIESVQR